MNVGFKVTVEFYCEDMIDEQTLKDEYKNDPFLAYKFISNNFDDSPLNFSTNDKIVKVELLRQPEKIKNK